MIRHGTRAAMASALWLLVLSGCAAQESESAAGTPVAASPGATLPPGHPPVTASSQMPVGAPPDTGAGAAALAWDDPDGWLPVAPSSRMRRAQYRVPGAGGDAECAVFYFGPGEGGDPQANVIRWADQFAQADGTPSRDALVTDTLDVGGIKVLVAEVTGTYNGGMAGMGGPRELADHMLLGAVAEGPDANWFFKLTGPEATVRENREAFMTLVRSLRAGD
jgi:hypothetical protein